MRTPRLPILLVFACLATRGWSDESGARLDLEIQPLFNGTPLIFDALTNRTAAGQCVSVTRLDLLLSEVALRRTDGTWLNVSNWAAYISTRDRRTVAEVPGLPRGQYRALRFHVGLPPELNHHDPAAYPPGHPLNPEVNGLHWGWMGGYVFLALEGRWLDAGANSSAAGGFSYHLATDRQLMTVSLPLVLDLAAAARVTLALNVDQCFTAQHPIRTDDGSASTHSRTNDVLAAQLRQQLEHAFTITSVADAGPLASAIASRGRFEMASNATPYRLTIPSYFPRPALPLDNPLTEEGVALGRLLFFDPQLSRNQKQSCSSCHQPAAALADRRAVSLGADGEPGTRNAPALFNLAWRSSFFWDGRAATLREQVPQPIQNPTEMHETLSNLVARLQRSSPHVLVGGEAAPAARSGYPQLFARAFGNREITAGRVARALEQFLLAQIAGDAKFDRVLRGEAQFTAEEQRGFELFNTEFDPRREQFGADCFHCHGGPLFQSQSFANNGLDTEFKDPGRYAVTQREGDRGKFAVPSLRNVEVTAPYMHDGRFQTLEEVVEHYRTGVRRSAGLDPNLAKHPAGGVPLASADQAALVAFLKTLTDSSLVPSRVSQALSLASPSPSQSPRQPQPQD